MFVLKSVLCWSIKSFIYIILYIRPALFSFIETSFGRRLGEKVYFQFSLSLTFCYFAFSYLNSGQKLEFLSWTLSWVGFIILICLQYLNFSGVNWIMKKAMKVCKVKMGKMWRPLHIQGRGSCVNWIYFPRARGYRQEKTSYGQEKISQY